MLDEDLLDTALMARVTRGDRRAFDLLAARHGPAMLRLARARSASETAAADVVQEALLAAFRAAHTYRPEVAEVRTWLLSITRNAAYRSTRRSAAVPLPDEDVESLLELGVFAGWGEPPRTPPVEARDARDTLAVALASLCPEDREAVLLRDVEGMSGEEAARVVGLSLAAHKSRLHRARLRLMAALREHEGSVMDHEAQAGGLRCRDVLARLGDYVDGELSAEEVARVNEHLRGCSTCERFGGRYASVVRGARERLGAATETDEATLAAVRARLDAAR